MTFLRYLFRLTFCIYIYLESKANYLDPGNKRANPTVYCIYWIKSKVLVRALFL